MTTVTAPQPTPVHPTVPSALARPHRRPGLASGATLCSAAAALRALRQHNHDTAAAR